MRHTPHITDEADLIVRQLLDARARLNRHGLALDWDIAGPATAKHKLDHIARATDKYRTTNQRCHIQRITVGPIGS